MVPDTSTTDDAPFADSDFHPVVNGLLGGIAGIVLSFVPFSTLLGGAIAGYLEGGRSEDGFEVGAIAGLVMLVPVASVLFLFLFVLGLGAPRAFGVLALVVLLVSALYTVGLGVLGGYLGIYFKNRY